MVFSSSVTLRKLRFKILATTLFGLLATGPALAWAEESPAIPAEFGKVIYQKVGEGENHLYIILQSHRNADTGANHHNTVEVQSEIYRIGEWLVRHENVGLLLPEGYFNQQRQSNVERVSLSRSTGLSLDDSALKTILEDTSQLVNADRLLMESYGLRLQQVEDRELYHSIKDFLFRDHLGGFNEKQIGVLSYMQEKRSAVMLQAVPGAIDREMRQGGIAQKKAIFTIGLAHVDELIRFLQEGKIDIYSPQLGKVVEKGGLKLLEEDYVVTIIMPKSLTEDREAVRIANLDRLAR